MGNPVTEFLEIEKKGSWGQFAKQVGLAAGTVAGTALAAEVYQGIRGAVSRSQGFKRMMAYNPELEKEDRNKVQTIFNTLNNVAPDLARDPLVASSWVKQMMYQQEYVDPRVLSDLATAQSRMGQSKGMDVMKSLPGEIMKSSPFAKGPGGTPALRIDVNDPKRMGSMMAGMAGINAGMRGHRP